MSRKVPPQQDLLDMFENKGSNPVDPEMAANIVWEAYPRKVGKKVALPKILRAIKKHGFQAILGAVRAYTDAREGEDPRFTLHPATYFNQERFQDDLGDMCPKKPSEPAVSLTGPLPGGHYKSPPPDTTGQNPDALEQLRAMRREHGI